MTYTHAKGKGQRSFSSKVRVEIEKRIEAIATYHVTAVVGGATGE